MIKEISSLDNKIIKYVNSLKDLKTSKKEKKFLIEGEHLLEMSFKHLDFVLTLKPLKIDESITQYIVNEAILRKISNNKSFSKVIGVVNYIDNDLTFENDLIYLDDVQDPGNVGTILRTSLAFNYKNILVSEKTASIYNLKTIQASQGAIFDLNIKKIDLDYLKELKNKGYKILVTTLSNDSIFLDEFKGKSNEKLIIVLGNEGQGVSKEVIELSDYRIKISISNIESLNVAIAGAITLYNLKK